MAGLPQRLAVLDSNASSPVIRNGNTRPTGNHSGTEKRHPHKVAVPAHRTPFCDRSAQHDPVPDRRRERFHRSTRCIGHPSAGNRNTRSTRHVAAPPAARGVGSSQGPAKADEARHRQSPEATEGDTMKRKTTGGPSNGLPAIH
jgi:hypothetical protein